MSLESEERLAEWVLWFHQNKGRIPADNLGKQCEFLLKAMDGLFEVTARALKDIQELEGHRRKIILPEEFLRQHPDITRFGNGKPAR